MNNFNNIKIVALMNFCVGGGSKLLQSQLDGLRQINSIPAYPLKYFYPFWREWSKKKVDKKEVLKLIIKHHKSLIDSRKIKGFNGLTTLGKKKNQYILISKKKFEKNFLNFLNLKDLNSKNVLLAIHYAYFKSKNINIKNLKYVLYHIHESFEFNSSLVKDIKKVRAIIMIREPINYFWKRMRNDKIIENKRFDKSDTLLLESYWYISSLISVFHGFRFADKKFFQKNLFIRFEDLITNNKKTLLKICKYLKINFSQQMLSSTFDNLLWWSDKIYKKKNPSKDSFEKFIYENDLKNFFKYEIFIIKFILFKYLQRYNYKANIKNINQNFTNKLRFSILLFFPTKFGLKNFFNFFNPVTIKKYFLYSFKETFCKKNIKDYYFNGMYRFKPQYKNLFFLKLNFFRKFFFKLNKQNLSKYFFLIWPLYFINKVIIYFFYPLNCLFLYFYRIYFLLTCFLKIKKLGL